MLRDKIAGACLIVAGLIFIIIGIIFDVVLKVPMTYTDAGGTIRYISTIAYDNQTDLLQMLFFGAAFVVLGILAYFNPIIINIKGFKKQ